MSKAIAGAAMLAGGLVLDYFSAGAASPLLAAAIHAMAAGGISMEAGAIAEALANNRGVGITVRQAAGFRQVIYGENRIAGTIVYESTTGFGNNGLPLYNMVIALAGHPIDAIVNLYLDGRQVYWQQGSSGNTTRNGINFGGYAANDVQSNTPGAVTNNTSVGQHPYYGSGLGYGIGPGGQHYTFKGKVYCEARYGDQLPGDIIARLAATDSNWAANGDNSPYGAGVTYVYLCVGYDADMFPQFPEVRFTVRGKNNIYDPRTATRGYTTNWALIVADALTDTAYGLGDTSDAQVTAIVTPVLTGGVITGGTVTGLTLVNGGTGYTSAPTVTIAPPLAAGSCFPAPTGTLATATATATLGAGALAGTVVGLTITSPGSGYCTIPLVTLTPSPNAAVNQEQLIAAANVCDEQVLTSVGYESNYTLNLHYDTSVSPGDALAMMLPAAAGRLRRIGGQWWIFPAYWQGPSFTFDESALVGPIQWTPYRSFKDLINRVNGTYIAPNYPYNCIAAGSGGASDLYDANGWWYGQTENVWPLAWQPTNYPQYAHDALHGWGYDEYLTADGGVQLPRELVHRGVISIVQAQRLAKIALMRNRQQGSGTFPMSLAAWQMQSIDVMQFTFSALGWTDKVLEIDTMRFVIAEQESEGDSDGGAMQVSVQVPVIETDPTVYEWNGVQVASVGQNGAGYTTAPTVALNSYLDQPYSTLYAGGLFQIILTNPITLYRTAPTVTLSGGGGSGASATAVLSSTLYEGGYQIASFNITRAGSGYTAPPTVTLSGGSPYTSPASATATLYGMAVGALTLTNGGSGYLVAPSVTINGAGTGATAYAVLSGGSVVSVVLLNEGYGYGAGTTVSIAAPPSGTTATATATLAGSSVIRIAVSSGGAGSGGGSGYTSAPTVTLSGGNPATGVQDTWTATISGGSVVSFTQTGFNCGYYASPPTVTITGGGGSGAVATVVCYEAYINSVAITNGGSGYTSAPAVTITPNNGVSDTVTGTATISGGHVTGVSLANNEWMPVPVTGAVISFSGGGGSGAAATAGMVLYFNLAVSGGSGYTSAPTVTLSAPDLAGGIQATATAAVSAGAVAGFTVVTPGSGYLNPPTVTLTGGGSTGASGAAALLSSSVASFTVTNPGAGYLLNPNVVLSGGGGYGAVANSTIVNGQLTAINGTASSANIVTFFEELSPYDVPVNGTPAANAGTIAVGAAAGSGATATLVGSATNGLISLNTGATGLAAGTLCTVTFPSAYAAAPTVLITASGIPSGVVSATATTTMATFTVSAALAASTLYQIGYQV